ncbi:MAG: right-handed parallel beta-helix repeat-containing protein [Archangiaceae bacterium]|nr:right-handed parallel beta-helix repeat-containing protein [Archangiaceae bacterium]
MLLTACILNPYDARGKACDAAHACPDNLACVSGVCGECAVATDCAVTETCASGACGACSVERPCPPAERCNAGRCEPKCDVTLQSLIDSAAAGSTLVVPACTFREQVTVNKALTLSGRPGAEVKGSDVFGQWAPVTLDGGAHAFQGDAVPALPLHGLCTSGCPIDGCQGGVEGCQWPEQVFVDGAPLTQVNGTPGAGQFSLGPSRAVLLGADPAGHQVEVTTRTRWLTAQSDGVSLDRLTFRHAASSTDGALSNGGFSQFRLARSTLADAHGALACVRQGTGIAITGSTFERAGQVGLCIDGAQQVEVRGNTFTDVNAERFDPEGSSGGIFATAAGELIVSGNRVHGSSGRGITCLTDCANALFENNTVDHTRFSGLYYGASTHGTLAGNRVWESGWGDTDWGWGAGLLIWASSDVEVHHNRVAWAADGLTVISQRQSNPQWLVRRVTVHDNTVVSTRDPSDATLYMLDLGWLEDWAGPLYAPDAGNAGRDNRFWNDSAESSMQLRFGWGAGTMGMTRLTDFAGTVGGAGSAYLSLEEKNALLADAGMPPSPEAH